MTEFSAWLDGTAARVFALCMTLFVVLNAGAVSAVFLKRDRGLVNRWTARWLAVNLLLIGGGLGVPIAAKVVRVTVGAFSAARSLPLPNTQDLETQQEAPSPRQ